MTEQLSRENEQDAGAAVAGQAVRPLPLGHRLGELQIEAVLGGGGFGIVYRAFDLALQRVVAIKEYMPSMLAVRDGDQTVALRSERFAQAFDAGRSAFLNEARLLAQFDHPGLVKVLHFGASHGTAYMVTPFYEGRTLKQIFDSGARMREAQLREIVAALLGALDTLHRAQCFHRDISLDNILIRPDGKPVLLDFGAARKKIGDLVDDSAMMLKPGYAPIEQYTDDPAFSQGPWTDLYALGAVMHAMVSGELPPAAVVRSIQDGYQPLASRKLPDRDRYSLPLLAAIDHALQLRIVERPESVAEFAAELGLHEFDHVPAGAERRAVDDAPRPPVPQAAVDAASTASADAPPEVEPAPTQAASATQRQAPEATHTAADVGTTVSMETQTDAGQRADRADRFAGRPTWLLAGASLFVVVAGSAAIAHFTKSANPVPAPAPASVGAHSTAAPAGSGSAVSALSGARRETAPAPMAVTPPAASPDRLAPSIAANASGAPGVPSAANANHEAANREAPTASLDASESVVAGAPGASGPAAASEPQPEPKVDTVAVRLHVRPWGEIYVGGVKRGVSPPLRSLALSPGVYQIEIRNGNLPPLRRTLKIDPGSKSVSIDYAFE